MGAGRSQGFISFLIEQGYLLPFLAYLFKAAHMLTIAITVTIGPAIQKKSRQKSKELPMSRKYMIMVSFSGKQL